LAETTLAETTHRATSALDRARELLLPEVAERAREVPSGAGYLDLIDGDLPSTGPTQDLMTSRFVPMVYERYWRPALGRVAKGLTGPGMDEEVRIARLLMSLSPGDTVLDVACGPGNFSREFARAVGESGLVVGIDGSRTMLERGAADLEGSEIRNLALIRGDATELPFRGGAFDGVCCFAALHLFAEPFDALSEMTRVLAPGGRIALMTSVRRQIALPPLKPVLERASGMRMFEADEIVSALRARGFREIHQRLAGMVQFVGGRLADGAAAA
jgi:SAM-dependent methyltransferase